MVPMQTTVDAALLQLDAAAPLQMDAVAGLMRGQDAVFVAVQHVGQLGLVDMMVEEYRMHLLEAR